MDAESLLNELNSNDEHERVEAKKGSSLGDSALESVCAFSNEPGLGGGHILFGVEAEERTLFGPVYRVVGVPDTDKLQADLATQCRELFNLPVRPRVSVQQIFGKPVVIAFVPEVGPSEKPVYFEKRGLPAGAFRRIGSTDAACTEDDLLVLYAGRQARSFDSEILSGTSLSDIDSAAIAEYRRLRSLRDPDASELRLPDEELLLSIACAESSGGAIRPTVAGLLLFGTRAALRRFFPTTRVDYIRIQGKEWVRNPGEFASLDIQRPLIEAIQTAKAAILDELPKAFLLPAGELQRRDIAPIPEEVIREALVNAVMHRCYRSRSAIQIVRYSNRLEIINPGYSLKAAEKLGQPGSEPRNPHIAAIFHDLKLAEQKGTGIQVMIDRMREAGLQPPHLESDRSANQFIIRLLFHHFLSPEDIAWLGHFREFTQSDDDRRALIFVREVGAIDNATYRSFSGADTLTASSRLRSLRDSDLLEMKGRGNGTYYVPGKGMQAAVSAAKSVGTAVKSEGIDPKSVGIEAKPEGIKTEPKSSEDELEQPPDPVQRLLNRLPQKASEEIVKRVVLALCEWRDLTSTEIGRYLEKSPQYVRERYLSKFLEKGLLVLTEHPSSKNVRYKISNDGREWLQHNWHRQT